MAIFNKTLKAGGQINDAKSEKIAELSSGPGPYMAKVMSNADYTKHGSLSVILLGNEDGLTDVLSSRISCRVMLPFYSVKCRRPRGLIKNKFSLVLVSATYQTLFSSSVPKASQLNLPISVKTTTLSASPPLDW